MDQRFTMIPDSVYGPLMACGGSSVKVYLTLRKRRNRVTGQCNPSYKKLATDTRTSTKTIPKALGELERAGLIKRRRTMQSNWYELPDNPVPLDRKEAHATVRVEAGSDDPKSGSYVRPPKGAIAMTPQTGHKPNEFNQKKNEPDASAESSSPKGNLINKNLMAAHSQASTYGAPAQETNHVGLPDDDPQRKDDSSVSVDNLTHRYPDDLDDHALTDRLSHDYRCTRHRLHPLVLNPLCTPSLVRGVVMRFEQDYKGNVSNWGAYVYGMLEDAVKTERERILALKQKTRSDIQALLDRLFTDAGAAADQLLEELLEKAEPRFAGLKATSEQIRSSPVYRRPIERFVLRNPDVLTQMVNPEARTARLARQTSGPTA